MSSELRNELDIKYEDRVRKIREAASAAIKEFDKLPSAELITRATFDAEVARIAQEKLHLRSRLLSQWLRSPTS
jgi:hypothetical protein